MERKKDETRVKKRALGSPSSLFLKEEEICLLSICVLKCVRVFWVSFFLPLERSHSLQNEKCSLHTVSLCEYIFIFMIFCFALFPRVLRPRISVPVGSYYTLLTDTIFSRPTSGFTCSHICLECEFGFWWTILPVFVSLYNNLQLCCYCMSVASYLRRSYLSSNTLVHLITFHLFKQISTSLASAAVPFLFGGKDDKIMLFYLRTKYKFVFIF